MQRAALFLDRDGVINFDYGYVHRVEDFEFIPGIFDLVRVANQRDYLVIVVTNQAGIGRGFYSEEDFKYITKWMCSQFKINGGCITDVYYCPDHPVFGKGVYKKDSDMRKPGPGMIMKAANDYEIDLSRSVLLGDKETDVKAGLSAGVKYLFHFNGTSAKSISISSFKELENFLQRN